MKLVAASTSEGAPQIVPFELPKDNPSGSEGQISQVSGVDPVVWPAKDCIWVPFTRTSSFVGKLRVSPVPTIQSVNVVLTEPPELFAQTM